MNRIYPILAALGTMMAAPAAAAPPVVGGQGLCPNASALAAYVQATYPGVLSIGGVRPCDAVGEHCSGHALDIMVGANTALGNQINADLLAQRDRFGIRYTLWQVPAHHDHVHAAVA